MRFGQEASKPPKQEASKQDKLKNEVAIQLQMGGLHADLYSVVKRVLNYLLGTRSMAYKKWKKIGVDIDGLPLTSEGRFRLKHQHSLFEKWVTPKPFNLVKALVPFLVIWAAQSFIGGKMQVRKIEGVLKRKRDKRRLEQRKEKERRRKEKGLSS